ncbi:MAG: hypothetical protein ACFFDN_17585 [Candidatus Hodarchaeota archaeon]
MIEKHYTLDQAVKFFESKNIPICKRILTDLCKSGQIGATQPNKKTWVLKESDIEIWLNKKGNKNYNGCDGRDLDCYRLLHDIKEMLQELSKNKSGDTK